MKRIPLLLCCLLIVALLFAGCETRTVDKIEVKKGSFAEEYAVDEKLDLTDAFLVVSYGKSDETIPVEASMISGFDTSTTGNKTFTVTYKTQSVDVAYRVYNPENASKSVVTTARLALFADGGEGSIEYAVHYNAGNLQNARAATFCLKSAYSLGIDAALTNLTVTSDFRNASYKCVLSENGYALKVILFTPDGSTFPVGGVLAKFRVTGGNNRSVSLSDIVLSDGENDYYLPPSA